MPDSVRRSPSARRLGSAAAALAGLLLFAYTVRQTGLETVADGFRRIGGAFAVILVLSGLRFAARAWAWVLCTEPPHALRLRDTFPALVGGDALGNLLPLGLFVSEPTKAALVRDRVSLMSALSGIALENLFYTITVAAMIGGGTLVLLSIFDLPAALRVMSLVALVGMTAFLLVALALASGRFRPLTHVVGRLQGHPSGFGFVIPERLVDAAAKDVYVPAHHLREAMHGDRVARHLLCDLNQQAMANWTSAHLRISPRRSRATASHRRPWCRDHPSTCEWRQRARH